MFKKPKRNFRGRKADSTTDDGDGENVGDATENGTGDGSTMVEQPDDVMDVDENLTFAGDKIPRKKKKKKDKEGMGKKSSSVLSFEAEEGDSEEIFTIKKSSHSKKHTKQLKKELQREKEVQRSNQKDKPKVQKKAERLEEQNTPLTGSPKSGGASPGPGSDIDFSDNEEPTFSEMLRGGQIPDAAMIHAIRKKRQLARDMGDYIPVDDTVKYQDDDSRLIRDDENDDSEEEARVDFTVTTSSSESNLRKIQQTILEAHEESEESDHDWEVQQIRKGVSIPAQTGKDDKDQTEDPSLYYGGYEQFVYTNTQASNTPTFSLETDTPYAPSPEPIKRTIPVSDLPKINMELMIQRLRERLSDLSTTHRVHCHERDDLASRMESCEASMSSLSGNTEGLAAQYRFFQEMRGYVTDLVECLNEKMPQVNYLERSLFKLWQKRAEKVVHRWQQDIKDESEDMRMSFAKTVTVDPISNPDKQRRVAEREARRSRRKRKREKRGIVDHQDGFSTDDEHNPSEFAHYNSEKERITNEAERLFEDVEEEFSRISSVKERFERWRNEQGESYHEAYIGLCLPKLFTPFVKLKLVDWNPLEVSCIDFQTQDWFETLMFYGYREGRQVERSDDDLKVMPSIIEKVLVPKLTGLAEQVWDPLSIKQTQRLCQTVSHFLARYPTLNSDSVSTKLLVKSIVTRIRKCLDNDVFMPLCPKQVLENRGPGSSFFFRQLNVCIKLLGNILLWHGVIGEKPLQEMALDALLNRYIMLGLRNSPFNQETLARCQQIFSKFPKEWFSSLQDDKTIPQLENLCGFVSQSVVMVHEGNALTNPQQMNPREVVKQVTKMLVGVHALEHALTLANKFSVRL